MVIFALFQLQKLQNYNNENRAEQIPFSNEIKSDGPSF